MFSGESNVLAKKLLYLRKCALDFVLNTKRQTDRGRQRQTKADTKRRWKILKISEISRQINRNEKGKKTTNKTIQQQDDRNLKRRRTILFSFFSFGYEG